MPRLLNNKIAIKWDFMLYLACSLFVLPVHLVINWLLAATVHEIFHIIALYSLKKRIFNICLTATGTFIETESMLPEEEIYCAIAGPLGGFSGLLFMHVNPYFAVCSFLQSVFNMLPLYPADGGRILCCILSIKFDEEKVHAVSKIISLLSALILNLLLILIMRRTGVSLLTIVIICSGIMISVLKYSLQTKRNNSTM